MRQVLRILANDLTRRLRSPLAVILVLLIPIAMTLIVGLVFGGSGEVTLSKIKVLVVDNDDGLLSNFIIQGMRQDRLAEMLDIEIVDSLDAARSIGKGKASAVIEIPGRFTADLLDGKKVELKVVKNPAENFLPVIVEEVVLSMSVILDAGLKIFSEPLEHGRSIIKAGRWPDAGEIEVFLRESRRGIALTRGYLTDSLVTIRTETVTTGSEEEARGFNIFAYILPGSMMLGLLFISELVLRDIVRERRRGTLSRILVSPVGPGRVVAGKVASAFAITAASCLILLLVSRLGFGMDLGKPLPLVLHLLASILMCTGLMTFFYGFVRSERAADAVISILIVVVSLFGGSMLPFEQMGSTLQKIGRFSPVYWASDGFKMIFLSNAGVGEISGHLLVLLGIGLAGLIPGSIMLDLSIRKGG